MCWIIVVLQYGYLIKVKTVFEVYSRCTFSKSWTGTYTWCYIASHILLIKRKGISRPWNGMEYAFCLYNL